MSKNRTSEIAAWGKKHTTVINIRLNLDKDKDILSHLDTVGKKASYIKKLIREDMKNQKHLDTTFIYQGGGGK